MNISKSKSIVIFEETVKTTNDNRIKLIEETIQFCEEKNIRVTMDHYEFYLVLDEAVSNAMEHGNRWVVDKLVSVKVMEPQEKEIEIRIEDEGNGFNPDNIPKSAGGLNTLSPRGRGIIIIRKFCKAFWNKKGNEIRLLLSIH